MTVKGHIVNIRPQASEDRHTDIQTNPLAHGKKIFLFFLQELFAQTNPTGLLWRQDPKETQVIIKGSYARNVETNNKKPMILVDRGGAQIASRTLGSIEHVSYKDGGYVRTEQVPFSLVCRVLTTNETMTEKIAWYVSFSSFMLRHVLIRQGFLYVANQMMISAPTPPPVGLVPGDQTNLVMIQLQLPCSHLMTGGFTPLNNPILQDVSTKLVDSETQTQLAPDPEGSQE